MMSKPTDSPPPPRRPSIRDLSLDPVRSLPDWDLSEPPTPILQCDTPSISKLYADPFYSCCVDYPEGREHQHHVEVAVCKMAYRQNVEYIKRLVFPSKVCCVLKADAYGHGLEQLAPVAHAAGADYMAICANWEAKVIRDLGLDTPILRIRGPIRSEIVGNVLEGFDIEETCGSWSLAREMSDIAVEHNATIKIHIEIDVGMGRAGFQPTEIEEVIQVCDLPGLRVVGFMTHLPASDAPDLTESREQIAKFENMKNQLDGILPPDVIVHCCNSGATLRLPDKRFDMVRVGSVTYGYQMPHSIALQHVLQVRTTVCDLRTVPKDHPIGYGSTFRTKRESLIAQLPIGIGDGFPREMKNGQVLIRGKRCNVIGRVSLNMLVIDVTDIRHEVKLGDEVVVIGKQGNASISVSDHAEAVGTIETCIVMPFTKFNMFIDYFG